MVTSRSGPVLVRGRYRRMARRLRPSATPPRATNAAARLAIIRASLAPVTGRREEFDGGGPGWVGPGPALVGPALVGAGVEGSGVGVVGSGPACGETIAEFEVNHGWRLSISGKSTSVIVTSVKKRSVGFPLPSTSVVNVEGRDRSSCRGRASHWGTRRSR